MIRVILTLLLMPLLIQAEEKPLNASANRAPTIVAVYADASKEPIPPLGWSFQWNAQGPIGKAANYEPLSYNENARAYGVRDSAGELRADAPRHTLAQDVFALCDKDEVGRCYIASYKLSADSSGDVWINHGNLRTPFTDGTNVQVYVNDELKEQKLLLQNRFAHVFQFKLGPLKKNDVIRLAIVPQEKSKKAGGRLHFIIEDCPRGQQPEAPVSISPALNASTPQFGVNGQIGTAFAIKHQAQCEAVVATRPEIVFIGDSITARWPQEVLEARFGKHRPINLGIGGDWIQNVLWRVQNGTLDKAAPKVVVMLIGTNNLTGKFTPDEIAVDIGGLIQAIQTKTAQSKILLLGILPRGPSIKTEINESIRQTNTKLATLADQKKVFYLDVGDKLTEPDGSISPAVMPDKLHVAGPGYIRWMEAMGPTLDQLLNQHP